MTDSIQKLMVSLAKDEYVRMVNWDLVIIDEAHRLRNVYRTDNKIAKTIKSSIESVTNKVLLTATPLQNSLMELYGLTSFIDEHIFGDIKSFKEQFVRITDDGIFYDLKEEQDTVEERKEKLIETIEERLKQKTTVEELFCIKWRVV